MSDYAILDCSQFPDPDKLLTVKVDVTIDLVILNATAQGFSTFIDSVRGTLPIKPMGLILVIKTLQDAINICELFHRLVEHPLWCCLKLYVALIDCEPIAQLFERVLTTLEKNKTVGFYEYSIQHYKKSEVDDNRLAHLLYNDFKEAVKGKDEYSNESGKEMWSLSPNSKDILSGLTHSNYLLWYEQYKANQLLEQQEEKSKQQAEQSEKFSLTMYS